MTMIPAMSSAAAAVDLTATTGYLVADARGRVIGKRIDTAGDAPRYLVDLEVSIFNQRDELCCPAEVTVELPG